MYHDNVVHGMRVRVYRMEYQCSSALFTEVATQEKIATPNRIWMRLGVDAPLNTNAYIERIFMSSVCQNSNTARYECASNYSIHMNRPTFCYGRLLLAVGNVHEHEANIQTSNGINITLASIL